MRDLPPLYYIWCDRINVSPFMGIMEDQEQTSKLSIITNHTSIQFQLLYSKSPTCHKFTPIICRMETYQSINQSINQSIHQSINQSLSQSINQSINQSNQSYCKQSNKWTIEAMNQPINCINKLNKVVDKDPIRSTSWPFSCPVLARAQRAKARRITGSRHRTSSRLL